MLPHPICWRKIADMLYVCTYVEGSTTLITQCGLLSWIDHRMALLGPDHAVLGRLKARVWETCDQSRVKGWMSGVPVDIDVVKASKADLQ